MRPPGVLDENTNRNGSMVAVVGVVVGVVVVVVVVRVAISSTGSIVEA
jgi:hypothetical protein